MGMQFSRTEMLPALPPPAGERGAPVERDLQVGDRLVGDLDDGRQLLIVHRLGHLDAVLHIEAGSEVRIIGCFCRRAFKFDHLCALNFDQV